MKITWGAIVTDGSGKLGGHAAQHGKAGSVLRTISSSKKVSTRAQSLSKQNLQVISQSWRQLSESDRKGWIDNTPTGLSGFNFYMQINLSLMANDLAIISQYIPPNNPQAIPIYSSIIWFTSGPEGSITFDIEINFPFLDAPTGDWNPMWLWTGWIAPGKYHYPKINKVVKGNQLFQYPDFLIGIWDGSSQNIPKAISSNSKMKLIPLWINSVTGEIFKPYAYEIIGPEKNPVDPPYISNANNLNGVFTADTPFNDYELTLYSFTGSFDFNIWKPEFYWNGWGPGETIDQRPVNIPVPESAMEFIDANNIIVRWGNTEGWLKPGPEGGEFTYLGIAWRNVETNEFSFERLNQVMAVDF